MTWAAACYCLKARDERIGWNPAMRARRLKLVVNNRRHTELVPKGSRPNLASQVLGMAVRELPAIWERQWGYRPLLAVFTMGVAAGAKDLKEAHASAGRLTNAQLRDLGCQRRKDALGREVAGEYVRPSYNALYTLLRHRDKAGRYDFDVADYAARFSAWMTAQARRLPRHLAADGKFVSEVVGLVSVVDAESGELVAVARDVDMRTASGQNGRGGAAGPVPASLEAVPRHDEGRPAVT